MLTTDRITAARKSGSAKIRNYMPEALAVETLKIVAYCHNVRGQRPNEDDMKITAAELARKLREDYGALNVEEVLIAVREGLYSGRKVYNVNAVDIFAMVRDYVDSDVFKNAVRDEMRVSPSLQIEQKRVSDDEAARLMLRDDYNKLKATGIVCAPHFCQPRGTFCYNYLVKCGKLSADSWRGFLGAPKSSRDIYAGVFDTNNAEIVAKARAVDDYVAREVKKRENMP